MNYDELLLKAEEVSKNAYAPYSGFPVGACVLGESGNTYIGCNVENASYGLTVCAERNAIANAVANGEKFIRAIAIYTPKCPDCPPCGACRQAALEFQGDKVIEIITKTPSGVKIYTINKLLPDAFTISQ